MMMFSMSSEFLVKMDICFNQYSKKTPPGYMRQLSRRTMRRKLRNIATAVGIAVCCIVACNLIVYAHWDTENSLRRRLPKIYNSGIYNEYMFGDLKEEGLEEDTSLSNKYSKKDNVIHVVLTLDRLQRAGLPVLISSILRNTNRTVIFHLGYCSLEDEDYFRKFLNCFKIPELKDKLLDFVFVNMSKLMDTTYQNYIAETKNQTTCSNFIKIKMHKVFPKLDKAIYLQPDMLVLGDVSEIWNVTLKLDQYIAIVRQMNYKETYRHILKDSVETYTLYEMRYPNRFLKSASFVYDTSVSVLNLRLWRHKREHIESEIKFWMKSAIKLSKKYAKAIEPWWSRDTEILLQLALGEEIGIAGSNHWNVNGLGWGDLEIVTPQEVAKAKLLHWDGPLKPWSNGGSIYRDFWRAQSPKHKPCIRPEITTQPPSGLVSYIKGFYKRLSNSLYRVLNS